jgi:hypothetical protein
MQTAADYMATEMSEAVDMTNSNRAKAMKAGSKLPLDPDTKTPDYFTAAQRRKKGLPEEAPANVTAGIAKVDPILAPKKPMKRFKQFKDM